MLTPERIQQLAFEHLRAYAQFVGAGDVWFEGEEEFARAIEAKAQAATLATFTPLVQQLVSALEDAVDDSNHVLSEYQRIYSDRFRPQRLHAQEDVVKNCDLALTAARAFLSGATKGEPS